MTWDLSKLYPGFDASEFKDDVEAYRALADETFAKAKSMTVTVECLEDMIESLKAIETLACKTNAFAELTLEADANCGEAMSALTKLDAAR